MQYVVLDDWLDWYDVSGLWFADSTEYIVMLNQRD